MYRRHLEFLPLPIPCFLTHTLFFRWKSINFHPKYKIKEYNPSIHNFNAAIVDRSYMFRLLCSNHHQDVQQKCKKEIILHIITNI
jgi:hypothetical protein